MFSTGIQVFLLRMSSGVVSFGINWLMQSAILILLGLVAACILRRYGSATQCVMHRMTLLAVMLWPIVPLGLFPGGVLCWSVELPTSFVCRQVEPAWITKADTGPSIESENTFPVGKAVPGPVKGTLPTRVPAIEPSLLAQTLSVDEFPSVGEVDQSVEANSVEAGSVVATTEPTRTASATWLFDIRLFGIACVMLTAVWILISSALVMRLWFSHRQLFKLRLAAMPVRDSVQSCCHEVATELGTTAPEVLRSPLVASPFLIGIKHPAIMLPEDVSRLELRAVLIHELAHLQRRDCFWLLLQRICTSIFWFQPLLHLVSRRMEATAEDVCDDYVVKHGGCRTAYANSLVEVATLSTRPLAPVGVAMVSRRSILERRVHRIMDFSRPLSTTSGRLVLALILLGGVVSTAAARLLMPIVTQKGTQQTLPAVPATRSLDKPDAKITSGSWATDKQIIKGLVWSNHNTPVPNTKVFWFRARIREPRSMKPQLMDTTDAEGRFSFRIPDYKTADTDPASWGMREYLVFTAKGHSYALKTAKGLRAEMTGQRYKPWVGETADGDSIVQLPVATEVLRGRIVDIDGQPVAGARITICNQQQVKRRNSIPGPPAVIPPNSIAIGAPEPPERNTDWHELLSDLFAHIEIVPRRFALPSATTNAKGEFELPGVDNLLLLLAIEADGFESTEIIASTDRSEPLRVEADQRQIFRNTTIHANDFSFVMAPSNPVRGRITDIDTGKPIVDAVVRPTSARRFSRRGTEDFAMTTDMNGHYEIKGLPIKKDVEIEAFMTNDVPWVPAGTRVDTTKAADALKTDIGLKKGLWAVGRVYDASDNTPFTGEIQYYWFRGDGMRELHPGAEMIKRWTRYHTNIRGEYRIPVLPTYGILAYRWDSADLGDRSRIDKFTRGHGADSLKRPFYRNSGTKGFYMSATGSMHPWNFNCVRDFQPEVGAKTVQAEMPMRSCKPFRINVVMADGSKPKLGPKNQAFGAPPRPDELYPEFEVHGLVEGWPRDLTSDLEFEITDLTDKATRRVFAYHEKAKLAGGVFVSHDRRQPATIRLMPAGSISGRLVDEDGEPVTDVILVNSVDYDRDPDAGIWADHPGRIAGPNQIPVDKEGRFHIDGLIEGWNYSANVVTERRGEQTRQQLGQAFENTTIETGQHRDLGDLQVKTRR